MARTLARTPFHSSTLIRVLSDLSRVDAADTGGAFAEKLAEWLNLNDAITLHALHNTGSATPSSPAAGKKVAPGAGVGDACARVRASVANAISKSSLPSQKPDQPMDEAVAFEPYRRYYLAQQRDMAFHVRPLRAQARDVLAQASPGLRQLASLDAVFDEILGEREDKLLSSIAAMLERRFKQLLATNQALAADLQAKGSQNLLASTSHWLVGFGQEMKTVLLAELELRLQPTVGLIEAFNHENTTRT